MNKKEISMKKGQKVRILRTNQVRNNRRSGVNS